MTKTSPRGEIKPSDHSFFSQKCERITDYDTEDILLSRVLKRFFFSPSLKGFYLSSLHIESMHNDEYK